MRTMDLKATRSTRKVTKSILEDTQSQTRKVAEKETT